MYQILLCNNYTWQYKYSVILLLFMLSQNWKLWKVNIQICVLVGRIGTSWKPILKSRNFMTSPISAQHCPNRNGIDGSHVFGTRFLHNDSMFEIKIKCWQSFFCSSWGVLCQREVWLQFTARLVQPVVAGTLTMERNVRCERVLQNCTLCGKRVQNILHGVCLHKRPKKN